MRISVRALLFALVATSVQRNTSASTHSSEVATESQQTCIAQEVVTSLESKIHSLETTNTEWATKLDTSTSKWANEKTALEKQVEDIQAKHSEAISRASNLDKKRLESELTHKETLKQVSALEKSVQQLTDELKTVRKSSNKLAVELENVQKKVQTYTDKIKGLEHELATTRNSNEALRVELGNMDGKLTMSSLLSLYYDEGVIMCERAMEIIKARTEGAAVHLTETMADFDIAKLSMWKKTEKLYATYLASTLDPIVGDVRRVMEPHFVAYRPIVKAHFKQYKKIIFRWYKQGVKRASRARVEATRVIQQQPSMAPYASIIVDGAIALVTIPLIIVVFRVSVNAAWWLFTTVICVMTCGCCCGAKKRTKLKRKMSRKHLASLAVPTNTNEKKPKKSTLATTSLEKRRTSGKKK